ncbi:MAG: metalloregulator ArsR/SmtB family transcription factor [Planctomycetia bacterium]|nr:metalloregulator ArsR/SmtB family transcription factor [Planctomycetia bacterium]
MGKIPEVSKKTLNELVEMFKLLADDTRLRILFYLAHKGELHVRALCQMLGQSQPAVSHHLALLRVARLIAMRREGKHNYYSIVRRRFDRFVKTFFSVVPEGNRLRLDEYVLSYEPAEELEAAAVN